MASEAELFFEHYEAALNKGDVEALTAHHLTPTIIVSDTHKRVCSDTSAIDKVNELMLKGIDQAGIESCTAMVNQAMRLSDNVYFVNVRWQLYGAEQLRRYTCHSSYTLQRNDADELKIIVAVIDDEDKVFGTYMDNTK